MMKLNLNFQNYTGFKPVKNHVKKIFKNIVDCKEVVEQSFLKDNICKELSIDFVFCDDDFIHEINKQYRGKDKPTDVISFALFSDDENSVICEEISLGEIIISIDTAQRQADEAKHSLEKEVDYLIAHGILHLLGFDHLTEQEYNFMVRIQNEVIKEF